MLELPVHDAQVLRPAVVVKKAGYSSGPEAIARSRDGMRDTGDGSAWHSAGRTSLVRPPLWRFVPMLSWSLARTVLTIGAVAVRQAAAAITVGTRRSTAPADWAQTWCDGRVAQPRFDR